MRHAVQKPKNWIDGEAHDVRESGVADLEELERAGIDAVQHALIRRPEDVFALVVCERLELIGTAREDVKELAQTVLQRLMEFEVEGLTGAAKHERSESRITHRNGYRERGLETRLGALDLRIPKLRQGSYFPAFLEPRKTAERALVAVIQEAWIQGISTRKIDDLAARTGEVILDADGFVEGIRVCCLLVVLSLLRM